MITLIITKGCSHCRQTENILKNKGIVFQVKDISDFNSNEQDNYIKMAKELGITSFPIIFDNGKVIRMEDMIQ